ncbi:MAG: hypothetical protein WBA23_18320 [Tunicatimonas sp.]|uniref:hypothetical protein n=1 Tax=Tunicatimonas sp. TaxID=1940096 RepID=UPI003C73220A
MIKNRENIEQELQQASDEILEELYEYIKYLQYKQQNTSLKTAFASEVVLGKDWSSPEEEQA